MYGYARDCGQRGGNRVRALEIIGEGSGSCLWMGKAEFDA